VVVSGERGSLLLLGPSEYVPPEIHRRDPVSELSCFEMKTVQPTMSRIVIVIFINVFKSVLY
jgi:hypothetical protein